MILAPISYSKHSYLICSQPEDASNFVASNFVMKTIVDEIVNFGDAGLRTLPRNSTLQVVGDGIFDSFFRDNLWLEVASDIIADVVVGRSGCLCKIR